MRILLLENDHLQAEQIERDIRAAFPPGEVKIELITTENDFRNRLDEIARDPPDIAILDVMVRWANPGPDSPPAPRDVREQRHYRAGLRCTQLLTERRPGIPIVLYTVLEQRDLERDLQTMTASANVHYVPKQADGTTLNETIRKLIGKGQTVSATR